METVLASRSISISDFKKNPSKAVREAGPHPIAVLSHNRPAFYLVEPKLFEALIDHLEDVELAELAAKRVASGERAIPVGLDDL
ncbi:MAG: type II toxin-antitoxin system Phd/YefM family antitoxin [Betaproteobacteria bacterium]|nr:type II toxin-antitoxin system Phd/YefM family antitoxin [Betaproteobacteria bacterium]